MKNKFEQYINKKLVIQMEDIHVRVIVLDVKERWGRTRLLIKPICGSGQQWVDSSRLINDTLGKAIVDSLNFATQ